MTRTGALADIVVLDLTQTLAGPFATLLLADQGARVIKIEPPGGEGTRAFPPAHPAGRGVADGAYGGYFASINRNKESLVLDLKSEAGRRVFRRLARQADIVVENFRAGVMDRLGIGYDALAAEHPALVYGAIRGFGDPRTHANPDQASAYSDWPAYDVVAQAMGGIMAITGAEPGGPPTKIGPGIGDLVPAMLSTVGLLSALHHARRTGEGQFVDVAMVDGVLAICERIVFQHSYAGVVPGAEGNHHPIFVPFGLFPAADGHVSLGCPHDGFWRALATAMGRAELADDPRYATIAARQENGNVLRAMVAAWTAQRTKAELAEILGGKVPFGPVRKVDEIVADPHTRLRGMLAEVEHPGADEPVTIAGTPIRMTGTPGGVYARAPLVGENTDRILSDAGFSTEDIAALRAEGAVG